MMDYKRIIKSRKMRLAILRCLAFVPDKLMVSIQYRIKTGRKLNLKNPQRFTEKLQCYKLFYRNADMIRCVDKADVRDYVAERNLEKILIPSLGVYESASDIDWDNLPDSFVMKDTLGMGGASVAVVKNKAAADLESLRKMAKEWTAQKAHVRNGGREWPYYSGKEHRIIFEKYIDSEVESGGLIDYKFFCFDGEPEYLYVITDREIGGKASFGIYDADFNLLNVYRTDEKRPERKVEKPVGYEEMKNVARRLSDGFPEARIDLYNVDGKILFGEITFWDGSGYMQFDPDDFDFIMGKAFKTY